MEDPKPLPKEVVDELVYTQRLFGVHVSAVNQVLAEVARAAGLALDVNQMFLDERTKLLREEMLQARDRNDGALASRLYETLIGGGG